MQWRTAGESHGRALVGIIEGIPAGVALKTSDLEVALARRRGGYGRGARQKFEQDKVTILSGVRHGYTLGTPIAVEVANSEWPKWDIVMHPDPQDPAALLRDAGTGDEQEIARNRRLTRPRPGHADLPGMIAYRQHDARNILERASARETAMRVALGEIARRFLNQACGIQVLGAVRQIGEVALPANRPAVRSTEADIVESSDLRCADPEIAAKMRSLIDQTRKKGDTLGGQIEIVASNIPVGLGTYAQWQDRLDGKLAQALMSIQSVKAVAIGDGIEVAGGFGSQAHDEIISAQPLTRSSNHAGGIEGGISNGESVVVRAWLKPISTVPRALQTIDTTTGKTAKALHQRSDVCAVVPAAVIGEAMVCLVLAEALLTRTGGGHIDRVRTAITEDKAIERNLLCEQTAE